MRLNTRDTVGMSRAIEKVAALGYRLIGVPLAPEVHTEEVTCELEVRMSLCASCGG
jgi:hypothetical protein